MKPFTESMRYEYPLTPDSVVLDCGAYEGNFARLIGERYGCRVLAFEPIRRFYDNVVRATAHLPNVRVFNYGVGGSSREATFTVRGDSTGEYPGVPLAPLHELERATVKPLGAILTELALTDVDLLKLNVEGMEFEILENLDAGLVGRFRNLQIQFHPVVPDAERRWERIRARLLETHRLTYDAPWCWENYALK